MVVIIIIILLINNPLKIKNKTYNNKNKMKATNSPRKNNINKINNKVKIMGKNTKKLILIKDLKLPTIINRMFKRDYTLITNISKIE